MRRHSQWRISMHCAGRLFAFAEGKGVVLHQNCQRRILMAIERSWCHAQDQTRQAGRASALSGRADSAHLHCKITAARNSSYVFAHCTLARACFCSEWGAKADKLTYKSAANSVRTTGNTIITGTTEAPQRTLYTMLFEHQVRCLLQVHNALRPVA